MAGANASGVNSGVEVTGIREFRKALKELHPRWPQALSYVHKKIAEEGAEVSRYEAHGMGGVQAKSADAIRGIGNMRDARIGIRGGAGLPMAGAAFWGAKRRTGWNVANETRNLPEWVGNSWEAAVAGQGPYAINDALAAYMPKLMDNYREMIEDVARAAFPEGG